jgi:hypothetical protein
MKNNKAAMEMSVGTIVTIVLLMSVLVLGLILTKGIFSSSQKAVSQIDSSLINEVNKLFAEENRKLVLMPTDGVVELKKGNDKPAGFAFSIYNNQETSGVFEYKVEYVQDTCGIGSTGAKNLFEYKNYPTGSFTLASGTSLDTPYSVFFSIPDEAPLCSIEYKLTVTKDGTPYFSGEQLFLRIK